MSIFAEVRQILLGETSIRKHLNANGASSTWRRALRVLLFMRMYCFLPFVLATAILMVLYGGGSAFAICMNTVALLFVAEIDDQAFGVLSEDARAEVVELGGTPVTAEDKRMVDTACQICHVSIPIVIMGGVALKMGGQDGEILLFGVYAVPFMLCGIISSAASSSTSKSPASGPGPGGVWRRSCFRGVPKALLGLFAFYIFYFIAFALIVPLEVLLS